MLPAWPALSLADLDRAARSVWRYRAWLPLDPSVRPLTLGEGGTPLVRTELAGRQVWLKVDYMQPTGSFKDRGSAVLAAALLAGGVRHAVEDSSGNAGASLAAYLAHAAIRLRLFVPSTTPAVRVVQAVAAGATVDGQAATRAQAAERAQAAVARSRGTVYASHVYSPYFLAGQATMAFEIFEDLGGRAPDNVVVPLGNGVLLLGLYHGFRQLRQAGLADRTPRLFGVQAAACAPIQRAFLRGRERVEPVCPRHSAAVGIAVADPPRGSQVLMAVRETGGAVLGVTEREMRRARASLARRGWFVEVSSAAGAAALARIDNTHDPAAVTVLPLTGSGLKG
jgi:threonine synthase